ncbi:MAG: phage terminase large subunit [Rickettsiales bacterium]|nr:phage terminase large subunit [Rickettsiales bacterium]
MNNSILNLKRKIYSNSLSYFTQRSFHIVNCGCEYLHNWHIDAITTTLEEIYNGNIKRLIINMPPRYLKSMCVSVAFPAWILGKNPEKRIIVASYSEKLTIKHSTDCRIIMESEWFKNIFTDCILSKSQNEKYKFSTTKNGYRFATSIGGTLTGEGGDILIVDDPHNPQQVLNHKYRQKVLDWYSNTFSSRLNDKKNGAIIIVMQRLHQDDLSGYLLNKDGDGWFHLNLPIIFEDGCDIKVGNFHKHINKGELLFEKREGFKEIEKIKKDMGIYTFNAQYQQKPMLLDYGIFKQQWLKYFNDDVTFENIYLSFDTAIKTGINNDPTVCTVWGIYNNKYYLVDLYRDWLEYPELKRKSLELINRWKPMAVLIEDKASGQSLIQDLKKEQYNIIAIKVTKDKITRFASVTPIFESERILIRENANWLFDLEYELISFPVGKHDDQVDSISQFLNWIENRVKTKREFRLRRI